MLINEGGNAKTKNGDEATKVNIAEMDEKTYNSYRNDIVKLVKAIAAAFNKATGEKLFPNESAIDTYQVFSGSGNAFFKRDYEEYTKVKPKLGDIDVQVDASKRQAIIDFLKSSEGAKWNGFTYLGSMFTGDVYNIFKAPAKYNPQATNIQIDFEFVDFDEDGNPDEFDTYVKNSEWEDMSQGIKGLAKQIIISTLYKVIYARQGVLFQNKKDLPSKNQGDGNFPTKSFGFKGTRSKYAPVLDADGNQVMFDGKPAVRELSVDATGTEKSVAKVFQDIFGKEPSVKEKQMIYSYTGVLALMKKYLNKTTIQKIFDAYRKDLDEKGGGEPEVIEPILNKFKAVFPYVVNKDEASAWELYINKQLIEG